VRPAFIKKTCRIPDRRESAEFSSASVSCICAVIVPIFGCLGRSVGDARIPVKMEGALLCRGDGFRCLLESFELRAMQEFGDIQQNDQTAFELPDPGNVTRLPFGKNGPGASTSEGGILRTSEAELTMSRAICFEFDNENAVFLSLLISVKPKRCAGP